MRPRVVVALSLALTAVLGCGPRAMPDSASMEQADDVSGEQLFELVRTYAAFGNHRAGTGVDRRTVEWFAGSLEAMGADVTLQPFDFQRFEGSSTVSIDGDSVDSLPLYYEGVGTRQSVEPFVGAAKPMNHLSQTSPELEAVIARAEAEKATIAVVATLHPLGALQIPNRIPKPPYGLPVVLVPGAVAKRLETGTVRVQYRARVVPGQSHDVVASFGDPASGPPVVLTTPLSGWFQCAAERGTGIAITLALARRLSRRYPVLVVGTSAHELPYLGLEAFLATHRLAPRLVVHLGANVALGQRDPVTGALVLSPMRTANVRMDEAMVARLRPALAGIGLTPRVDPPQWFGESALWSESTTAPLLSLVGIGPEYHTPDDRPERTTSPELLRRVFVALDTGLHQLLE